MKQWKKRKIEKRKAQTLILTTNENNNKILVWMVLESNAFDCWWMRRTMPKNSHTANLSPFLRCSLLVIPK
jgi:hypothetical protein